MTAKNNINGSMIFIDKGTKAIWRLLDNREFDELMSRKLGREMNQAGELLELDFIS